MVVLLMAGEASFVAALRADQRPGGGVLVVLATRAIDSQFSGPSVFMPQS